MGRSAGRVASLLLALVCGGLVTGLLAAPAAGVTAGCAPGYPAPAYPPAVSEACRIFLPLVLRRYSFDNPVPYPGPGVSPTPVPAGTWRPTGPMAVGRMDSPAVPLPTGRVLVAGGASNDDPRSAELYDPASGTWSPTGGMSVVRDGHTATLLPSGKVLVAGGRSPDPATNGVRYLASAELYDPATGTWSPTGSLATNRVDHTATLLPSGKVLVAGGSHSFADGTGAVTSSAELYDPATGGWSPTGGMGLGRVDHTATLLPDGKVLVAGGCCFSVSPTSSGATAELYDPVSGAWTPTGHLIGRHEGHRATLLPTGKVLVVGGCCSAELGPSTAAELYDPGSGTWTPTSSMSAPRFRFTAALLRSGRVLVAGSCCINLTEPVASAELYDPVTGAWRPAASMAVARGGHSATLLPDGDVLVAGGLGMASAELYTEG